MRRALAAALIFFLPAKAMAMDAKTIRFGNADFDVVRIDLKKDALELVWLSSEGDRFGSIRRLRRAVEASGRELLFATNAGIFERGHVPLGLTIAQGKELVPINRGSGEGNFYLPPNGVFFMREGRPGILPTEDVARDFTADVATQSGPLLIISGKIHARFNPYSASRYIRSGVGVCDKDIVFAISRSPVTFHHFARLFSEGLGCSDALYLDGQISRMYVKHFRDTDTGGDFAAMLAVTKAAR